MARSLGAAPGRGGGHVPLVWGEESLERAKQFEVQPLSPARAPDLENTATLAEDRSAPDVEPEEEASQRLDVESSGGRRVWRRSLAPRHRRAVREFFGGDAANEEEDG